MTILSPQNLSIPNLGLGTWSFSGDSYGSISEDQVKKIVHTAMDSGIELIDTSPTYGFGRSESLIGKFAPKNKLLIATKVGMISHLGKSIPQNFSKKFIASSVEGSLKRLKREFIDLIQLHSPLKNYLEIYPDLLETLDDLVKSGKVGAIGISLRTPDLLEKQVDDFPWSSLQFNYSLLDQRINLQKLSEKLQIPIRIARTVFNFGFLTTNFNLKKNQNSLYHLSNWPQVQVEKWIRGAQVMKNLCKKYDKSIEQFALRFPVDSRAANIALIGVQSDVQLKANIKTFRQGFLSKEELQDISNIYKKIETDLKIKSPYKYVNSPSD